MSDRTYASWVEPIARAPRESRAELVVFARSLSADAWSKPSPLEGWTYRDLLAQLAGDTGKVLQGILKSVVAREPLDSAILNGADEANGKDVEARRDRTVNALLAEIEADGEELDELFSQLTEEDKDLRQDGFPMSLGEGPSNEAGGHYREHLAHMKTALEG